MKEYTIAAVLAAALTVLIDRRLGTHVLRRRAFWIFLAVMYGFKLIANGYLTWRPIVMYNPEFFLGIRVFTIPVEDFVYGFSLIAMSVILWEYFKQRSRSSGTDRRGDEGARV